MGRTFALIALTASIFLLDQGFGCAQSKEKPTLAQISARGKAATAMVVAGAKTGSAFCVHSSGLFVTNEHVTRNASSLKIVLDSASKTQRVLEAKVIRTDATADLSLVRVEGVKDLSVLPLGNCEEVAELTQLFAFGFPFGTTLNFNQKDYPAISVNICTVSSLRRKAGELERIDLNGAINPGQSGGPLLDQEGRVVGVIVSGIRGSGISQAIPVGVLARFLERPEISFIPSRLDAVSAGKPVALRMRLDSPLPSEKTPAVEVTLMGEGKTQRHKMEWRDGAYQATVVPVPPAEGPQQVQVTAHFAGGTTIVSPVSDRTVKVGEKSIPLKDLLRARFGEKPQVVGADGSTHEGALQGLEAVDLRIGEHPVKLDLGKAESLQFVASSGPSQVTVAFTVTLDGKEIASSTSAIQIVSARTSTPSATSTGSVKPPEFADDSGNKLIKKLPSAFQDVVVGGNGRYLIFSMPQIRKLAVFDVSKGNIAGYVPMEDNDTKFAAGMDKLVIAHSKGRLERWDLATLQRELTVTGDTVPVRFFLMGHASAGPVLMHTSHSPDGHAPGKTEFLDLRTLKPVVLRTVGAVANRREANLENDMYIRVSADGQTFAFWKPNSSPQGLSVFILNGDEIRRIHHHSGGGHLVPGPNGKVIYSGRGRFTAEFAEIDDPRNGRFFSKITLPALQGNYYLALTGDDFRDMKKVAVQFYCEGEKRALLTVNNLVDQLPETNGWGRDVVSIDKRLLFIPDAKVVVILPKTNDEVVVQRLDIEEAMEKSGADYLVVTSTPPAIARRGSEFRYQIRALTKKERSATFQLDSGPDGMRVSRDGLVTWEVPQDPEVRSANVILTVRDGSQDLFHTFSVRVE